MPWVYSAVKFNGNCSQIGLTTNFILMHHVVFPCLVVWKVFQFMSGQFLVSSFIGLCHPLWNCLSCHLLNQGITYQCVYSTELIIWQALGSRHFGFQVFYSLQIRYSTCNVVTFCLLLLSYYRELHLASR